MTVFIAIVAKAYIGRCSSTFRRILAYSIALSLLQPFYDVVLDKTWVFMLFRRDFGGAEQYTDRHGQ